MRNDRNGLGEARAAVERGARQAADSVWMERMARAGYAAKGAVYATIGVLALQAALGSGGRTTGSRGAIESIGSQPFGQILLGLVAFGLVGYALWRFAQSLMDVDREGRDAKALVKRTAWFISGLIHAGLAFGAVRLLTGSGGGGGGEQEWTARVLAQPFGRWLVGGAGAAIMAAGLFQMYRAVRQSFREKWHEGEMTPAQLRWGVRAGQWGLSARGIVFLLVGGFLLRAALDYDPAEARGLGGALRAIEQQPFGPWLLALVAAGLIAYALFCAVEARFRGIGHR